MNISFIGAGQVGAPLATRLAEVGHTVVLAETKEGSEKVRAACAKDRRLSSRSFVEAVGGSEIVFLAVPFGANESVLRPHAELFAGKVLIDCTNPVGPGLSHGLKSERSGSEFVQSLIPKAKVVKAFSIYGYENFENPVYPNNEVKPAMFFCGEDQGAKQKVATLISDCGFEPLDVGGLAQALHLEHMTLLWVRMVRANHHSPNLVWAALKR